MKLKQTWGISFCHFAGVEGRESRAEEGKGCTGKKKSKQKDQCSTTALHEDAIKAIRRLLLMPSLSTDTIGCCKVFLGCGLRRDKAGYHPGPEPPCRAQQLELVSQ